MKFTGKELYEIGVPKKRIKNFINKEFNSKQSVLDELNKPSEIHTDKYKGTWFEFLWDLGCPHTVDGEMSKTKLKKYLNDGSILINGRTPNSTDLHNDEWKNFLDIIWFYKSKNVNHSPHGKNYPPHGYGHKLESYYEDWLSLDQIINKLKKSKECQFVVVKDWGIVVKYRDQYWLMYHPWKSVMNYNRKFYIWLWNRYQK